MKKKNGVRAPHDGVYARLGRSRLHGVGAIAIRSIPKGARPFIGEDERVVWVPRAALKDLPAEIRSFYDDFGILWRDQLGVPVNFNRLSVGWYVNHSDEPNLVAQDDGRFIALRHIHPGEELTADYRTLVDEPLRSQPNGADISQGTSVRRESK
jgi:SET domain-containing protein